MSYVIRRNIMLSLIFSHIGGIAGKHVLDAGCGEGSWGHHIRSIKGWNQAYKVGIDLFKPYASLTKRHQLYDDVIVGDVRFLPIKDSTFDFVLSVFVLEHLTKADGDLFLNEAKRVCRRVFVLVTEYGFKTAVEVGIPKKSLEENPLLHHLSGWTYRELNRRSFTVRGVGFKYGHKFPYPFRILFYVLFPLAYIHPEFADKIIAYRVLRKAALVPNKNAFGTRL